MRVAIMQPYLFPYLGYFQLIASVDKFIFYDDVNFIKGGWINRNRILLGGRPSYFTVPLSQASPYSKICEVEIDRKQNWLKPMERSFAHAYGWSEKFDDVKQLFGSVLADGNRFIGEMAKASVMASCNALGINVDFKMSSTIYENSHLHGAQRVLDICVREGATEYINLPGGRDLYDSAAFLDVGIKLTFIEPVLNPYRQRSAAFVPALSVLDGLVSSECATRDLLGVSGYGSRCAD